MGKKVGLGGQAMKSQDVNAVYPERNTTTQQLLDGPSLCSQPEKLSEPSPYETSGWTYRT